MGQSLTESAARGKTFYIETFGCQMNVHDSEKVIGTLEHEGYAQVEDEEEAGLILYNTCSIRDKAEQKVFNRLNEYKRLQSRGSVCACWGAWRSRRARRSLSARPMCRWCRGRRRTASCRRCWCGWRRARTRITGLDDRQTDETFETEFTARTQSASRLHHDHRGLRQVLRVLRGAVYARQGAQPDVRPRCWPKRGGWRSAAIPRSSCWGRT